MSRYIYAMAGLLIAIVIYAVQSYINGLELENNELKASVAVAVSANSALRDSLEQMSDDYAKGLEALNTLKQEKVKEVKYVSTIKERIVRDNNSTCLDSINAVFQRLHEQRSSSDENNTATENRLRGGGG